MKINKNNEIRKSEIVKTINQKEQQMKPIIKMKQDYYGNEDYGKRAFWIIETSGQMRNYVFYYDLKEWVEEKINEGYTVEIEYDGKEIQAKWKPNLSKLIL